MTNHRQQRSLLLEVMVIGLLLVLLVERFSDIAAASCATNLIF